jgi:hypothetical protein
MFLEEKTFSKHLTGWLASSTLQSSCLSRFGDRNDKTVGSVSALSLRLVYDDRLNTTNPSPDSCWKPGEGFLFLLNFLSIHHNNLAITAP